MGRMTATTTNATMRPMMTIMMGSSSVTSRLVATSASKSSVSLMVASSSSSLPVSSPTAMEEDIDCSKPSTSASDSDRLLPARTLSSTSSNWLMIQRLPTASRLAINVATMGTPLEYRLDSVRAKRAVQIFWFSLPMTGACSCMRSHWRRTAGWASAMRPPTTKKAATKMISTQLAETKSDTANKTTVGSGRESICSNIGMNWGTTKPIKIAITPTIMTDRMMGYIKLLPTCWLTLCSRS